MPERRAVSYTYLMCGIAGIYNPDGAPLDSNVLTRMARALQHRGPDGERFYMDGGLGLAHRHLRIIDLSDAAMQPMTNEDGTLWLIFNGEIYNYIELRPELEAKGHRFCSRSDTEVLLHAYEEWGADCLRRLNGMFAFALWDSRAKKLFLARDRMGVKPLYYWWDNHTFLFASEIKALLEHPLVERQAHLPAIAEYMSAMYTTGEHTWFRNVKRLLPGHFMLVEPDGLKVRQWWDVPASEDELGLRPERSYIRKTRELLEDSVQLRLRSDVPLGAHLSGGLDSSAIVALLSRQLGGEPVRTFSGAFAEGSAYDERLYVKLVVERYRTEHHETVPVAADLPKLLDKMIWHMDEPAAGPGILLQWAVCRLSRQAGVTVINGGQGGDEAWGGYFGYIPAYMRTLLLSARRHPQLLAELLKDGATMMMRPGTRKSLIAAISGGRSGRLRPESGTGNWAGDLFTAASEIDIVHRTLDIVSPSRDPLSSAMYWDLKWYLPALLQVEDRTSMAFSLESRAPLLDYRLIEHAASVPSALKLKDLEMKHILREAIKDLLPASIYRRTDKMGMPTPIALWFKGELANWVRGELLSEASLSSGLLSKEYVQAALNQHTSGKIDRSIDLWKMLNVAAWWRVYMKDHEPYSRDLQREHRAIAL